MGPSGHLAEPQTTEEHDKIIENGKTIFGNNNNYHYNNNIWIWIGVDQIGRTNSGSFLYASTR